MELDLNENIEIMHKHSRRVHHVYILCIVLIIIGVLILGVELFKNSSPSDNSAKISGNSSEIIEPKYLGKTEKGQGFEITSDKARELKEGVILLYAPQAMLFDEDDNPGFGLDSISGVYDNNEKTLTLNENVELDDEEGNSLKAKDVKLDLDKNIIYSDNKIDLSGKIGKITADGLEIKGDEKIIIFKGKSKMIINNIKGK
ncbi:MAG: LPS export ABC transporter periplasmic protein LptC [Alphaproteobacteria bacterium]|nr:LPS export ABC transporter periplasmic protein LptC [Alphaproteobacteria bacterium]